jgi:peptidoglycan LD-endopeptidase LytH
MTRFGRWFAGGLALLTALFIITLAIPREPRVTITDDDEPLSFDLTEPDQPAQAGAIVAWSGLVVPVAGVRPADLVDSFGDARSAGGAHGHGALDVPAPRGTAVLAAADGMIEQVFESERGGHTVYVRSPNRRNVYYYAHLDTYAPIVREGAAVRAGQRIGTVGSSGDADPSAPHLHFEIKRVTPEEAWHEGRPLNPYPLLAGKPGGG